LPQGKVLTLRGKIAVVDENGYRQWIALRPVRPLCTLGDPDDQFSPGFDQLHEVQAVSVDREDARSRLERLVGHEVDVTGTLTQWQTGYQRAPIVFEVDTVQPIDAAGEAALRVPDRPKPVVRDVVAYYVTGPGRSVAHQRGTRRRIE